MLFGVKAPGFRSSPHPSLASARGTAHQALLQQPWRFAAARHGRRNLYRGGRPARRRRGARCLRATSIAQACRSRSGGGRSRACRPSATECHGVASARADAMVAPFMRTAAARSGPSTPCAASHRRPHLGGRCLRSASWFAVSRRCRKISYASERTAALGSAWPSPGWLVSTTTGDQSARPCRHSVQ
jgi:hypothetical protein